MAHGKIRKHLKRPLIRLRSIGRRHRSRPRVTTIGPNRIITEGLETNLWRDFYHNAMTVTWPVFFAALAGAFIVFNLLFAVVYSLGEGPVANARPGSYSDLFFFSAETLAGVGYGFMYPQTVYGHMVAACESFLSLVSLAVMTGLVFSRFSRPRARLIFARNPVIAIHNGAPTLMVRIANARNNFISDASAKLWVIRSSHSSEGRRLTGFHEMRLERSDNPIFALSWTLLHVIGADSQLNGMNPEDIAAAEMNFVVTISGLDEVSAQVVHARNRYAAQDLRFGHEFVDIITIDEEGMRHIDYAKVHDTRPLAV